MARPKKVAETSAEEKVTKTTKVAKTTNVAKAVKPEDNEVLINKDLLLMISEKQDQLHNSYQERINVLQESYDELVKIEIERNKEVEELKRRSLYYELTVFVGLGILILLQFLTK